MWFRDILRYLRTVDENVITYVNKQHPEAVRFIERLGFVVVNDGPWFVRNV